MHPSNDIGNCSSADRYCSMATGACSSGGISTMCSAVPQPMATKKKNILGQICMDDLVGEKTSGWSFPPPGYMQIWMSCLVHMDGVWTTHKDSTMHGTDIMIAQTTDGFREIL